MYKQSHKKILPLCLEMIVLYNLSIALYRLLIGLVSPFNKKASLWIKGRKNVFAELEKHFKGETSPVAWFHIASLGEFEQARTVIEAFKENFPTYKVFITFFSPSGYEIRKNYPVADFVSYLPLDTKSNVERFIRIVNPKVAFFVKYEFWYHYLHQLKKAAIPVYLFSAIFRKEQPFFSKHTELYRSMLFCFEWIFVQNKESVDLLKTIELDHSSSIGDTRFDRVAQLVASKKEFPLINKFKGLNQLLVAGSVWQEDMKLLIPYINQAPKNLVFILAPHELNTSQIEGWRKQLTQKSSCYSMLQENETVDGSIKVLFIDNIGMLSSLYQYAEYSWIGGGFGKGLHNCLEAATYGMPLFFGPNYQKFKEARDLIRLGLAFSFKKTEVFEAAIFPFIENEASRKKVAEQASEYVRSNTGATNRIIDYYKKKIIAADNTSHS